MADYANIHELREEVLRRQKAANAKIARLNRKGVSLSGTSYDIRRPRANVSRYNTRQLKSYLNQLNDFTSRRNSFVGGVEGTPIPRANWNAYKRVERAYQKTVNAHYEAVKDVFIPAAGKTVAGYDETMRRKRAPGKGGVARPLEAFDERQAFQVTGPKNLAKLQESLERKLAGDYIPKKIKQQRKQALFALKQYGDPELEAKLKALTDEQFDVMWNYSEAPRDLYGGYQYLEALSTNKKDLTQSNLHEDATHETREWLNWAGSLEIPERSNRSKRR